MATLSKKLRRHTRGSLQAFLFMVVACFVGNVFYGTASILHKQYVNNTPFTNYVEYYSIKPAQETFNIGEELWFVSDSEYKKPVSAEWNDILFCDFGKGQIYVRSYKSNKYYVKPRDRKQTTWSYNYAVTRPAVCQLESTVKIKVDYGIEKTFIYTGETFKVQ